MKRIASWLVLVACVSGSAQARDELVTSLSDAGGEPIPYILTSNGGKPSHAILLMPGGAGNLSPRMDGSQLVMSLGGNFLIRTRELFARPPIVAASIDATTTPGRIMAIARDLQARFGPLAIYVAGNSRGSYATMTLAPLLDGQVAGFIHTSSLNAIASFDTRPFRSRHLIVHHTLDLCTGARFSAAVANHRSYGTALIAMEGGTSIDRPCEARAHHGFYGVEQETVDRINAWILAGK
jgi:hypothetical protein